MTGRVRPATAADARSIADVHVRAWRWAYRELLPTAHLAALSVDAREQLWLRSLAAPAPTTHLLVWDQDGGIRGFVAYGPARDEDPGAREAGKIYALYLDEELLGHGAGRALHDAALGALRGAGFTGAVLWVLEDNARGRAFYGQQGWAPDGLQRSDRFGGPSGDEHRSTIRLARRL
jgi:GNAT superfamily N-acetyltransferase